MLLASEWVRQQSRLWISKPDTLTTELVHEFIEKIVVSAHEYKDGKRYQKVEIHYNSVGIVREPTAEEMEEYFQEHIGKKPFLKAKTASPMAAPH